MCQFDSKPSFVILASQANATSHSVSFDELESNLPVYSAISPRLPPLYQDRREIDAPTHQSHLYSSILLTSSPTPVLPSICFYESLIATIWNTGCLLYLITSVFPSEAFAYSNAEAVGLKNWLIALGVLILGSNWISMFYGLRCLVIGEEGLGGFRKTGIWVGTIFSMLWMFVILGWFTAEQATWVRVDVGILILCGQLGILEQVYYEYQVKLVDDQIFESETRSMPSKSEYSLV